MAGPAQAAVTGRRAGNTSLSFVISKLEGTTEPSDALLLQVAPILCTRICRCVPGSLKTDADAELRW